MDKKPEGFSGAARAALVGALLVAGIAIAQTVSKVDQGKPGNQGPWPVTCTNCSGGGGGSSVVSIDGGVVNTVPLLCANSANKMTTVGTAASNCPATQSTGRRHIVICNSSENATESLVKIRVDGLDPVIGTTNPGDVLSKGDCIVYVVSNTVIPRCIANSLSVAVTSYECF